MLNKTILIGRLTNDIELRKTGSNIPYTYFTLAVNRPSNNDQADFISCVAWRGTAELMDKYVSKGSQIAVEGRIEVYRTQNEGGYETRTNVNVQTVTFLDSKRDGRARTTEAPVATGTDESFDRPVEEKSFEEPKEQKKEDQGEFKIDFDSIKF